MSEADKTCPRCRSTLPLASFGPGDGRDFRDCYCRECRLDYQRKWRAAKNAEHAELVGRVAELFARAEMFARIEAIFEGPTT